MPDRTAPFARLAAVLSRALRVLTRRRRYRPEKHDVRGDGPSRPDRRPRAARSTTLFTARRKGVLTYGTKFHVQGPS